MLSREEKKELLDLAKSSQLRNDFRRLSQFNKRISLSDYLNFITVSSKIFESERLEKYRDLRFEKLSRARKFIF